MRSNIILGKRHQKKQVAHSVTYLTQHSSPQDNSSGEKQIL